MNIENTNPNAVVGADVQYSCLECGAVREIRIMNGKPRPKVGVCRECDGETAAFAVWDVCAAEVL